MSAARDRQLMRTALRLAARGAGRVSPNPMVGAVVARDGEVLSTGWHRVVGGDHAEVDALRPLGFAAPGCDLFVNLEPCCHREKRTPPCVPVLVTAGLRRVVVGAVDPNPRVAGRGIAQLRAHGIEVEVGVCGDEARRLNAAFETWITTGRPRVTLKLAATLDGRIADRSGGARWISSEASRRRVQRMRAAADCVLVGAGTARADDPLLLPRGVPVARMPLRVVVDAGATLPLSSQLARTVDRGPVLVAASAAADPARVAALRGAGVEVLELPAPDGRVALPALLDALGRRGVVEVLAEGGAALAASLLRDGLAGRLVLFAAPMVLADPAARPWVDDLGLRDLAGSLRFAWVRVSRSGPDAMLELEPAPGRPPRAPS